MENASMHIYVYNLILFSLQMSISYDNTIPYFQIMKHRSEEERLVSHLQRQGLNSELDIPKSMSS